jgi:hypothetical protein
MVKNILTIICISLLFLSGNAAVFQRVDCIHDTDSINVFHDDDCEHSTYSCPECSNPAGQIIAQNIVKRVSSSEKLIHSYKNTTKIPLPFDRVSKSYLLDTKFSEYPRKLIFHYILSSIIIQS